MSATEGPAAGAPAAGAPAAGAPAAGAPAAGARAGDDWSVALLAVARGRDRRAFAALFAQFAPRVKAFMMRAGMAPAAAEEIAQEAMLAVWRKAELFDAARASAATWIFAIARNLRIDAARREGRANACLDHDGDGLLMPDPAPMGDALLLCAEREGAVRAALAALPEEQAAIIRLSFFEEQPHGQIARQLHIPLGTVKSRVRLAVARLRKALEERP